MEVIRACEAVGVDASVQRAYAVERIGFFGEYLSSAVRLSLEEQEHLRERVSANPGDQELEVSLHAAEAQLDREVQSLGLTASLLEDLGLGGLLGDQLGLHVVQESVDIGVWPLSREHSLDLSEDAGHAQL